MHIKLHEAITLPRRLTTFMLAPPATSATVLPESEWNWRESPSMIDTSHSDSLLQCNSEVSGPKGGV